MPQPQFEHTLNKALEAFWATIAEAYPSIATGDLAPDVAIRLREATAEAALRWLDSNLPEGSIIQTEDGYKLTRTDGEFTDGDMSYSSLTELGVDFTVA